MWGQWDQAHNMQSLVTMWPMVSSSQCAAAGHYVNIVVDDKKPTKSSDVYEHIQ